VFSSSAIFLQEMPYFTFSITSTRCSNINIFYLF